MRVLRLTEFVLVLQNYFAREDGQDLVEYALVVALIAFGAVASMKGLSTEIQTAFNVLSSDLGTAL
jgi:pilus assembly protein Flp/PilA